MENDAGMYTAEVMEQLEDFAFRTGCLLAGRKGRHGVLFATIEDIRLELHYSVPEDLVQVVWKELEHRRFLGAEDDEGRKPIIAESLYFEEEVLKRRGS